MNHSKMDTEQINNMIKIFQKLLENDKLNNEAKSYLVEELREAKLEIILNRK